MSTSFFGSHEQTPRSVATETHIAPELGPRGRFNHSASLLADSYQPAWLIFGGCLANGKPTDELVLLDLDSGHWSLIQATGESPSPRYSHATAIVERTLYLYGGTDGSNALDDIYVFDLDSRSWRMISTTGDVPKERSGHTLTAFGNNLYLFGGLDNQDVTNDLYCLNLESYEWTKLATEIQPNPRYFHSMTVIDKHVYLFGGRSMDEVFNDIWKLTIGGENATWEIIHPSSNVLPSGRFSHAACSIGKRLYITCGRGASGEPVSDIHFFDTAPSEWVHVEGDQALPICESHTAAGYKDKILIYGGRDIRGAFRSEVYRIGLVSRAAAPSRTPLKPFIPPPTTLPINIPVAPVIPPATLLPRKSEPILESNASHGGLPRSQSFRNNTQHQAHLLLGLSFLVGGIAGFWMRGLYDQGAFKGMTDFLGDIVSSDTLPIEGSHQMSNH